MLMDWEDLLRSGTSNEFPPFQRIYKSDALKNSSPGENISFSNLEFFPFYLKESCHEVCNSCENLLPTVVHIRAHDSL